MSLFKRPDSKTWWINITTKSGKRLRESTGTTVKQEAQEYHDIRKAELWRENKLGESPKKTWEECAVKYVNDKASSQYLSVIKFDLEFLLHYFAGMHIDEIDANLIDTAISARRISTYTRKPGGKQYKVSTCTVNHMIKLLKAIMNHVKKLGWLNTIPNFSKLKVPPEEKYRIRWLTKKEFARLKEELPEHLVAPCTFAVSTGLRESNITHLKWSEVDLDKKIMWVYPDESKTERPISVPLNEPALNVLHRENGKHSIRVFTYKDKPFNKINTLAFKKAVDRAKIAPLQRDDAKGYPKHDLDEYKYDSFPQHSFRHTFASWHVQAGTPLPILQKLGCWSSYDMVLRYAHLAPDHTAAYANNISF